MLGVDDLKYPLIEPDLFAVKTLKSLRQFADELEQADDLAAVRRLCGMACGSV